MKTINRKNAILVVGILLLIIISAFILINKKENNTNQEIITDKNISINKNQYNMKINYPVLEDKSLNKYITKYIDEEKEIFLDEIKDSKSKDNELNINYTYTIFNNLYSIHINSFYYIGKDNYHSNDKIIYYDDSLKKEIMINELILNNKFYEVLRIECYNYLINNKDKYNIVDLSLVKKRLVADASNYQRLIFNDDYVEVILEPNSVSEYNYNISIEIKYNKLIEYLNVNYFEINDDKKEIDTNYIVKEYDRIRESKYFENKKLVALTFDDGPSYSKTDRLIDELDKRNARVSFFMLGQLANRQKDLVKKVYNHGHTIGSHSYDHKNLIKLDDEQLSYEIDSTNKILSNIIGDDIRFMRPPYGSYNHDILEKTNMAFILWNVDTLDWKYRDAEKVRDYIVENASDGDIIILHDIHSTSIDGALMAIDILKEQGFEFVSLDEMLVYKNINVEYGKAYRFFR